jgi:hypothetical protein
LICRAWHVACFERERGQGSKLVSDVARAHNGSRRPQNNRHPCAWLQQRNLLRHALRWNFPSIDPPMPQNA